LDSKFNILVYGYGNPGRQDDGLGVALSELIEKENFPGVKTDSNYQLNAEDALEISERDVVIFADASRDESVSGFSFTKLEPAAEISFTTHSMSAPSVLALCEEIYKKTPDAYMLGIKGFEWEINEGFSEKAKINLEKACYFLKRLLADPDPNLFVKEC